MNASVPNNRLDYLDAVRAFALLLGIVFHASMSFMPFFIGWAVMDTSTSSLVSQFMLISHSFRMELFFLIAGYFSHMTFHRKGAGAFINSRLIRIAIPFVVGWFLLKPLVISGWAMGAESMRGEVNILNGLKVGVQNVIQSPNEFLTGSHLWFLYYLLLITAMALALRGVTIPGSKLYSRATKWVDQVTAWLAASRCSWLALSGPTAGCLWFMSNWGMDTPDKSLVPHVPVLCVYGGFFVFGWLLHRQPELIERFARLTLGRVAICVGSVGATIFFSRYQAQLGHPNIGLLHAGFAVSYAMMMWSLVCVTIGLFKKLFNKPSKVVRYLADSSYWLYLIHLPIVIWLQIAFAEMPFDWALKLIAISLLTVGISLVLYDLFVRPTLIGKTLNGRRNERMLFTRRSKDLNKAGLNGINAAAESC